MGVILRAMGGDDLPSVAALERASFDDPWCETLFADELSRPESRRWIVADGDGHVLGYAGVWLTLDALGGVPVAHLLNVAVDPSVRGRGLGRALVSAAMETAIEADRPCLTLEVRAGNAAARALYASCGFEVLGARTGYYADTGEDGVVMATSRLDEGAGLATRERLARQAGKALADLNAPVAQAGAADADAATAADRAPLILAIETSCDETAAAVVRGGREVLSSVIASQIDFHARFGGVVPEIASRKHTEAIVGVVAEALDSAGVGFGDLDALAVTHGPGLVGALVVGLAYAKGLSLATGLPLVGVNHLESHIFAAVLSDPETGPPLVALVVSGGHTSLVHMPQWGVYRTMGATLDDATGEAFDKVAKVLGLGYPGGPVLSRLAADGDPAAIAFPRAMMESGTFDFSLSGLKTAVINHIRAERDAGRDIDVPDLAASFQQAIIDVQVAKSVRAVTETGSRCFIIGGGVAANPALRAALTDAMGAEGVRVSVPPPVLCTDNAAMVGAAAHFRYLRGEFLDLDAEAVADLRIDSV